MSAATLQLSLNNEVICPSCWHVFPPEKVLWLATHPDLIGDPKTGPNESLRFLPTRFDLHGNAIDVANQPCSELACPHCHLKLPRPCIEVKPAFFSIVGTPSCGKSYFLASMAWQLRQTLPARFKIGISDADPMCNRTLNDYEEQQFFNPDRDTPVRLKKTEEQGDDYASSMIGGQAIQLPRPFLFYVRPIEGHPNKKSSQRIGRLLCLYDNAGESYTPGRDSVSNPVTRHLAQAAAVLFCFDPTQDPRMRLLLQGKTLDSQVTEQSVTARQEIVFHEMAHRFRRLHGLGPSEATDRPLVVIVTKFDGWSNLVPDLELIDPIKTRGDGLSAIDLSAVGKVSKAIRELLFRISPELITSAESFSNHVWFIPVSATGRSPETDPTTGITGVRPRDVAPVWCDVPLLTVLSQHGQGLIPFVEKA